jgi:ketosteroid isomerase-like protein
MGNLMTNVDSAKRAIQLFHSGRTELMRAMLADDIVWRVPHANPLAADIEGVRDVIEFFERVQRETAGTFGADVLDLAGDDRTIFCLMRVHGERNGKKLDQKVVNIWRLRASDGKVVEREIFMEDLAAADEFWAF